jgi:hypothetical protein
VRHGPSDPSPVDWSALRHAYGRADDVPIAVDRLRSGAVEEREAAIGDLWGELCHQETVYSASAAAVPLLFDAARVAPLTAMQRYSVLGLIVYIGRGADTCWEGYSSWEEVASCRRAVADVVPAIVRWATGEGTEARAAAVALAAYFPEEFAESGVDFSRLADPMSDPVLEAACALVSITLSGRVPDDETLSAAASADAETSRYAETSLADGYSVERRTRLVVLELLHSGVASALAQDHDEPPLPPSV